METHLTPGEDQQPSDEFMHVMILFIDYCELETIYCEMETIYCEMETIYIHVIIE